ncbi:MAG: hypothetical protein M9962_04115 [Oligoflexia bacterium]|nr:hypothetical protein [Oligoflexia bacterium]
MKIFLFCLISLFFSDNTFANHAKISIHIRKSSVDWSDPNGRIIYESVCRQDTTIVVHDFREHPERRATTPPTIFSCQSTYKDQPLEIKVSFRNEIVLAREFGLSGDAVKRIYASLYLDVGSGFPYLQEVQSLTGQQTFYRNINHSDSIFTLSPFEFLEIICSEGKCRATGPEAIFRADIEMQNE